MKKIMVILFMMSWLYSDAITIGGSINWHARTGHCFKRGDGCDVEITIGIDIPIGKLSRTGNVTNYTGRLTFPSLRIDNKEEIDLSDRNGESYTLKGDDGNLYRITFGNDRGKPNFKTNSIDVVFKEIQQLKKDGDTKGGNTVIVSQKTDFTWDLPEVAGKLGYKTIILAKGDYSIRKDEKYPYGRVTLYVKGGVKINNNQRQIAGSFITSCYPAGGWMCKSGGFNCLVMFPPSPFDNMSVEPVFEGGKLIKINLIFLAAGITNGNRYEDGNNGNNSNNTGLQPVYPFVVTFTQNGGYTSNNPMFLNSYPPLVDIFVEIAKRLYGSLKRDLTIEINSTGTITSTTNESVAKNGTPAVAFFNRYAEIRQPAEVKLMVTANSYNITGVDERAKNFLPADLSRKIKTIQEKLGRSETFVLTVDQKGTISSSNPKIIPNIAQAYYSKTKYDEYRDCVGYYWWAPIVAQVACAVGAALS